MRAKQQAAGPVWSVVVDSEAAPGDPLDALADLLLGLARAELADVPPPRSQEGVVRVQK